MGGFGSGRTSKIGRRPKEKVCIEWVPSLSSFKLMPGKVAKANGVTFLSFYRYNITVTKENLKVTSKESKLIFETPMKSIYSGLGERYFFTCPHCKTCTSRLYYSLAIGCRKCLNLSYLSQNISNEDRWFLKRKRLLQRYDMSRENADKCQRRKGMHKKTFDRFINEYHFINEMRINISLNRFDYKRVFFLLREGRKTGKYQYTFSNAFLNMLSIF